MDEEEIRQVGGAGAAALVVRRAPVPGAPAGRSAHPGPGPRRRLRRRRQHRRAPRPRVAGGRAGVLPRGRPAGRAARAAVVRGDARRLPFRDESMDLVMSTDMWEHIDDDEAVARETARVLRPGGRALVAVPCSMKLWSGHDVALGHERRYERDELVGLMSGPGLEVVDVMSWNVLLRPVARAPTPAPGHAARARWSPSTRC